jgi:KaiC/GvpD/RAD55 family RecA-like ATPase
VSVDSARAQRMTEFLLNDSDPLPETPPISLRSALAIAMQPERATWLLRPYLERGALVLMVGAEGTFKSFLALDWALQVAMTGESVIFLHAEGRGLWKRLRAWCLQRHPHEAWSKTLNGLPFVAVERPLNLSSLSVVVKLTEAIDAIGKKPALIVVDTMTRNSDGLIEQSNGDAVAYLNMIDGCIRARYHATIILIHHVGHGERQRARGPFSLIASTDANYLLERPNLETRIVTVRSGRMKDCEPPPPFELEAEIVSLDVDDEDGKPETSIALRATGNTPVVTRAPTGKAQRQLLAELERLAAQPGCLGVWPEEEIRAIGRGLGMHKSTARDASHGLRQLGYFIATIGGSRLAHLPGKRTEGAKRDETTVSPGVLRDEKDVCLLDTSFVHPYVPILHPENFRPGMS